MTGQVERTVMGFTVMEHVVVVGVVIRVAEAVSEVV